MSRVLRRLTTQDRRSLLAALDQGQLAPPFPEIALGRYVGRHTLGPLAQELARLSALGLTSSLLRELLELSAPDPMPSATLVWTGPEDVGSETRDTGVVVRELFARAERHVLVACFAIYQGKNVFEELARRMEERPALRAEMYVNIDRREGDTTAAGELVHAFSRRFKEQQWPGTRLPALYYDPRSLRTHEREQKRAVLHAKCIVVDGEHVFVTSANFTEAAQERNIEAGLLLTDTRLAGSLVHQFEQLVSRGLLLAVPGQ